MHSRICTRVADKMEHGLQTTSGVEETRCCLCHRSVMKASALVKCKLFHGQACASSKKLINDLFMENLQLSLLLFKEMNDLKAYLCHHCHGQTSKYLQVQEGVRKIKEEVLSMASNLTTLPVATRKRTVSTTETINPPTIIPSHQ